jgi:NAD(P)-dependent dehydrogenase (short-subunit alcohol dehydrogenase family)
MSGLFHQKVALITGAASGIGRAIAFAAAREGASLVLGDVQEQALGELAEELGGSTTVHCQRADVTCSRDIAGLMKMAEQRLDVPDLVFANAGIEGPSGASWECSEADFLHVIDVNLVGIWRTAAAVLPKMLQRGSGAIVATASVAGIVGAGGLAAYVASKHGVVGLVRSMAIDSAAANVRINAICPGMIETPMVDRLAQVTPGFREALLAQKPMGRLGLPIEAAEAAVWLASDKASFVTGHTLVVDGGYAAH